MLALPDGGLHLESSYSSDLPLQAFGITLNDSVIEDMIKCFQNGERIELHLGNSPVSSTFGIPTPCSTGILPGCRHNSSQNHAREHN